MRLALGGPQKERRRRRAEKRLSKSVFWRVRFFSATLRFALKTLDNLKGAEKKRTLQKHPFGQPFLCTTPSPLLWRTPILHNPLTACILHFYSSLCNFATPETWDPFTTHKRKKEIDRYIYIYIYML